jgi:PAS domain S-box-containing protein
MSSKDDEGSLLRSVALQNAQSILLARQRAEEELVRAKEALELKIQELAHSLAMMRATLEATTDGVLATDSDGRVTDLNEKFVEMWRIPREIVDSRNHGRILEFNSRYFEDPQQFLSRADDIYKLSPPETYDLLQLSDGRVFERFSRIQFVEERIAGRVWSVRDITDFRVAEEALRRQSEWLRVTLASIGDAVVTTDTEGKVVFLNGMAQTLTGWTQQEAQGRQLTEVFCIINEETRQTSGDPAARALKEGTIVGLANHTVLIAKDGTERPIDDSAAPIRDDAGHVYGAVLIFRDIAERKLAEEALRSSERELSEFFENATVGLHWVGPNGIILRANRTELEMLGYTREEYVGHTIAEFHVDKEVIGDILRRLQAGEEMREYESRMRCKDGSIKHVLINSNVRWEDGRFIHTRCFTRDVTDRKRVDEAQARLATIVESSQDAIISTTLDNRILSWNAGAERLLGYTAGEVIGKPAVLLHPVDRQDEERVILERLNRAERIEPYETVRLSKAGQPIDVSLTVSPIFDSTGRVIGASKIARSITANKRAERRLIMENGVTRALAESGSLSEAAGQILSAMCEPLGWDVGAIWFVDQHEKVLRCSEVWHRPSIQVPQFEESSRARTFQPGIGLPGRVWSRAEAAWIPNVVKDDNFPRAPMADHEGLQSAFAFPIVLNDEVLGVIEFFSREISLPDAELLQVTTNVGSQIGQFIERKRAEEALRESEQRFRLMAETLPLVVWTAAPDGTITYSNERWFEYCGLTLEQNANSWPQLVLHPDDYDRCIKAWTRALREGKEYEIEVRNRRRDGAYRWFVTRAVPLRDDSGSIVQWFGTSTDIDDRKRAEQSSRFLADASATLAELADYQSTLQKVAGLAVPAFADWCAVDMLEADGSIRRLAVTHVDPDKVRLARDLFRRYPPQPSDAHGLMRVLRTGEPEWMAVIPDSVLIESAQSEEHLEIVRQLGLKSFICAPLRSPTRTLGALSFVTAESGRVYDESDVAAAGDLADRASIAIENSNLLMALKDADQRKDEFLAMLAHELRNPLAPIRNAVHIFRRVGPPVPELQWANDVIDRQVYQMTRLVDDLLDVSRITRGKIELRKERVELAAIVNSAVEASRPLIETSGHELLITVPEKSIPLDVDPTRLSQVLSNLLNNAAKYTAHAGRISLTAEQHGDHVQVSVKDTGIGISAEMLPRVFDMFTQGDRSLERAEGGLGIGLTLVHRLIKMHGGTVEARSDGPGKGSEFIVSLPIAMDVADHLQEGRIEDDEHLRTSVTRRILVVDDNLDSAESLVMLLTLMGNEVHTAHDGLEAVAVAASTRPDVILMDLGLPNLNGYEAARRIREQSGSSDMVLVALTGWGQEDDRRRSKEAGFDHHLTKPVDLDVLQQLLAETNAGSSRREQSR